MFQICSIASLFSIGKRNRNLLKNVWFCHSFHLQIFERVVSQTRNFFQLFIQLLPRPCLPHHPSKTSCPCTPSPSRLLIALSSATATRNTREIRDRIRRIVCRLLLASSLLSPSVRCKTIGTRRCSSHSALRRSYLKSRAFRAKANDAGSTTTVRKCRCCG